MYLLVIVGINGRQGTSVANAFLNQPSWRIRGLTRNDQSASSQRWKSLGVEIVEVNLYDEWSIRDAFDSATAIFAVTDYYSQLSDHSVQLHAQLMGDDVERIAAEHELRVGRTIVDAAAHVVGLRRFVLSTLSQQSGNTPTRKGMWQTLMHYDLLQYLICFNDLGEIASVVKPCIRMEDYRMTLRKNEDGTLTFGTTAPGTARLPWINMTNDFGSLARTLILHVPSRQNLAAISEWLSGSEICALINDISGLTCTYRQLPHSELSQHPSHIMADLIAYNPNFAYYEPNVSTPEQLQGWYGVRITKTLFREFLKKDLLRYLETLLKVEDGVGAGVGIFASEVKTSLEEARATSEKVEEAGWKMPRINPNGHDRSEFIGNHTVAERQKSFS